MRLQISGIGFLGLVGIKALGAAWELTEVLRLALKLEIKLPEGESTRNMVQVEQTKGDLTLKKLIAL